jgi:hypothetical protein
LPIEIFQHEQAFNLLSMTLKMCVKLLKHGLHAEIQLLKVEISHKKAVRKKKRWLASLSQTALISGIAGSDAGYCLPSSPSVPQ